MTPLFPRLHEPIILKQGAVDDCFLLTSLDCVLNSQDEYRRLIMSKFRQSKDGVTVRIKRTAQSAYLKPEKMRGKYTYHHDKDTDEDVFFLSNRRLQLIDDAEEGVQSNSLAVKILERLSSYYYIDDWVFTEESASIEAHNVTLRYSESSTTFVGKLLGIQAHDTDDFAEIIKLKLINPQEAVYMSMAYGDPDLFGKIHERHSFRIDKVIPKAGGGYELILVNPWDNQKREIYSGSN